MPSSREILEELGRISNEARLVAIAWHIVVGLALAAWTLGWRPSCRAAALCLTLPVGSVGLTAWIYGNPFNGTVWTGVAVLLGIIALRMEPGPVERSSVRLQLAGAALVAFGWLYPHFLEAESRLQSLYAAPLGLVPCPTLSLVIGFTLMLRGFGSRPWMVTLIVAGLFYGLFGWLRLGVAIDSVLLLGTAFLAALLRRGDREHRPDGR